MFSLFCWPFYATRLVFASAAEGDGERSRAREGERSWDRLSRPSEKCQCERHSDCASRVLGLPPMTQTKARTPIDDYRRMAIDDRWSHAHNNGERADELSAFLKADRMIDSTVCLTASVPLPISLSPLIATILSHFVNGGAMEIGTISRQTPQLRQDQLIRAAKTSVIEVLIVSRAERERERVENWSCQWGRGRGVQQQQQER